METSQSLLQKIAYALTLLDPGEVLAFQTSIESLLTQLRREGTQTNLEYISVPGLRYLTMMPASLHNLSLEQLLPMTKALQPRELALLEAFTIYLLHDKDFKASLPEIMRRNTIQVHNPAGITEGGA